jgi:hypothetical protein
VRTTSCQPLANAVLDIWHADARGGYDNDGFGMRGTLVTDRDGRWSLKTIIPGRYLNGRRYRLASTSALRAQPSRLTTQLYSPATRTSRATVVPSLIGAHSATVGPPRRVRLRPRLTGTVPRPVSVRRAPSVVLGSLASIARRRPRRATARPPSPSVDRVQITGACSSPVHPAPHREASRGYDRAARLPEARRQVHRELRHHRRGTATGHASGLDANLAQCVAHAMSRSSFEASCRHCPTVHVRTRTLTWIFTSADS